MELKEYIKSVYEQECSVYEQRHLINKLSGQARILTNDLEAKIAPKENDIGGSIEAILGFIVIIIIAFLFSNIAGFIVLGLSLALIICISISDFQAEDAKFKRIQQTRNAKLLERKSIEQVIPMLELQCKKSEQLLQEVYNKDGIFPSRKNTKPFSIFPPNLYANI